MVVTTSYIDPANAALDRTTGEVVDETRWHALMSDIRHRGARRGTTAAWAVKSAVQSISSSVFTWLTWSSVSFQTVGIDGYTLFDAAFPTRLTAPEAGIYLVTASVTFHPNVNGSRQIRLLLDNAVAYLAVSGQFNNATGQVDGLLATTVVRLGAGQFIEVLVYQDSGSSIDVRTESHFGMIRIGERG